ncbi:MAG: phosphopantetheine-binding protein [Ruminococcus flavefaciens]|nr:phosphopantetheine-binding protein [Ruminococcus flavefaciens]MCM1060897.1 phosphopantetheine-binding protein [Eubacterium sp.]
MLDKMKEIICNYVETAPEEITENSRLIEDIGLNSYDFMCMLGDLETEFGVTVDETEVVNLRTVGEAIAYLIKLKD